MILDEIIAYLHTFHVVKKKKKKNYPGKSSISLQPVTKKVQNLEIFGKIIAHVRKQLQKIVHLKKSAGLCWVVGIKPIVCMWDLSLRWSALFGDSF